MAVQGSLVIADRYVLGQMLAAGGMAEVYVAEDQVLGRAVAVKLMRAGLELHNARARFLQEARTLAQFRHPNLVTLLDAGTTEDRPYLVMELVEGQTLADLCARETLSDSQVGEIGTALASALSHVHAHGIVHRDVKPGNVLIGSDGRVLLSDFGIAKLLDDSGAATQTLATLGSPPYLSPEQVRGETVGPSSDIYSLGLVLLEALTGRQVFAGSPVEAAMARLATGPDIPNELSRQWRELLRQMLALDAAARPTAEEVRKRLVLIRDDSPQRPVSAAPPAPVPTRPITAQAPLATTTARTATPPRRLLLALVASVLGLLAVAVVGAILVRGGSDGGTSNIPRDLPTRISGPLEQLHNAIEQTP